VAGWVAAWVRWIAQFFWGGTSCCTAGMIEPGRRQHRRAQQNKWVQQEVGGLQLRIMPVDMEAPGTALDQ
jgi:hypothetical protein